MRRLVYAVLALLMTTTVYWGCSKHDSASSTPRSSIDFTNAEAVRTSGAFGVYEDGWMGNEAEIVLGNSEHQPALLLEGTNVETKAGDETLRILFLVGSDTVHVSTVSTLGNFSEMALLPQKVRALDTLELSLITTKSFVPSRLGTSRDDRTLSFRLRKISLVPGDKTGESLPASYEFPRKTETDPNVQGIYSDGWMADSASIMLFNPENKTVVEVRGFVPGNIFQRVATLDVLFGGQLVVRQQVQGNFQMRFQLPDAIRGDTKLSFTLKPSGTFVPSERGISSDTRRISYQMRYIGLR
jgi:hypothetical protein